MRSQAYRDYEVNKLETVKLALVKLSVIESIICEYQEEVSAAAAVVWRKRYQDADFACVFCRRWI